MKKFIISFFVVLGVIFFILLLALGYVYSSDMFGVRTLLSGNDSTAPVEGSETSVDKNPLLSPAQEKTLETIGVDPAKLPQTITPEMMSCFNEKLGTARTIEIKNGSAPTPAEYLAAKVCF